MVSYRGSTAGWIVAFTAWVLISAAPAAAADPVQDRHLDRGIERLLSIADAPSGIAVTVQRKRELDFHSDGVADLATGAPWRPGDHMRLASTSKAFSGAVALQLVEAGQLSLDTTIAALLPELPAAWGQVTLAQALHHTSGLPDFTSDEGFLDYFGAHLQDEDITPVELLEFVFDEPLGFRPDTDYHYSNSDNVVVGLMAEAVTGRPYAELISELVAEPLGLERTALPPGSALPGPLAHGYDAPPSHEELTECCSMAFVWASGGLYSSSRDLNLFARGLVGRELFGRAIQQEQFDWWRGGGSEPPGPGANSAGLGIFRYRTNCGTVFGHTGNFPGYAQFFAARPSGRRSVTVSVNTQLSEDLRPETFSQLRGVFRLGVCAALA